MRWDGSAKRMVLAGSWNTPLWSPDGDRIALESIGGDGITLLEGDDLRPNRIFEDRAYGLRWSPTGTRLAFYGPNGQSDFEVWAIGSDGTGLVNLSHYPVDDDRDPAW